MCLRYSRGEAMEKTLAWAEGECEGFMRGPAPNGSEVAKRDLRYGYVRAA